jgi:TupA-like ATPgrasp
LKALILSHLPTSARERLRSLRINSRHLRRDLEQRFYDCAPDSWVQARNFRRFLGRRLNLASPETFNEKLHWLMLNYRRPELTELADKYSVRRYVAARVGDSVLNDLYGVWDDPWAVPFADLPDAFVLKVTSSWGQNIFCRDKSTLDIESTRRQLAAWMLRSGYWAGREWAYKDIKPRIVCERLLTGEDGGVPADYKFFCFGGQPRLVQVDTDRFTGHRRDLFDPDWRKLPVTLTYPSSGRQIPIPKTLKLMLSIAATLSRGFPFVRVDLYSIGESVIFGELTWYPGGGVERFTPDSYDLELGKALVLPARVTRSPSR